MIKDIYRKIKDYLMCLFRKEHDLNEDSLETVEIDISEENIMDTGLLGGCVEVVNMRDETVDVSYSFQMEDGKEFREKEYINNLEGPKNV